MDDRFEEALTRLAASKKYAGICPETLRRVLQESFRRHKKPREAEKAAREKLHGITGAFLSPEEVRRAGEAVEAWREGDDATLSLALAQHASTRERLPLERTDALFERIFACTGRPGSVLDLACGLNPLYLAARGFAVAGVDIQQPAVELVSRMGRLHGLPARGILGDLLSPGCLPEGSFDLALVFKLLPLLERERPGSAAELLSGLDAPFLAVSFPTRTLGGRRIGMEERYGAWMEAHVPPGRRVILRFTEADELVFVLGWEG